MRHFIRVLPLTALLLFAGLAQAAPPSAEAIQQAATFHKEAGDLLAAGKYVEAAKRYLDAYGKNANPNELYNAARAELTGGRNKEALKLFRAYLALPETDRVAAEYRQESTKLAATCESKLCPIDIRGAKEAWVDSERANGVVFAEPGAHEILMEGDAGPKTKKVTCDAGQTLLITYEEKPKGPDVPPPPPPPKVVWEMGCGLLPGLLGGVGLVGVGVGIGLGAATVSKENELTAAAASKPCDVRGEGCVAQSDAFASAKGLRTGFIIGYAVGASALVGAAVATLVLRPWEERPTSKTRTGVSPWVMPGAGGFTAFGRF